MDTYMNIVSKLPIFTVKSDLSMDNNKAPFGASTYAAILDSGQAI